MEKNNLKIGDTIKVSDVFEAVNLVGELSKFKIQTRAVGNVITVTDVPPAVNVVEQIYQLGETFCDNFCKYGQTCDENCECEWTRTKRTCPVERLM